MRARACLVQRLPATLLAHQMPSATTGERPTTKAPCPRFHQGPRARRSLSITVARDGGVRRRLRVAPRIHGCVPLHVPATGGRRSRLRSATRAQLRPSRLAAITKKEHAATKGRDKPESVECWRSEYPVDVAPA